MQLSETLETSCLGHRRRDGLAQKSSEEVRGKAYGSLEDEGKQGSQIPGAEPLLKCLQKTNGPERLRQSKTVVEKKKEGGQKSTVWKNI